MTFSVAATAVAEDVSVRLSCRATRTDAAPKMAIQAAKSPRTASLIPSGTIRPPTTKGVTALGCTILKISCKMVRNTTMIRMTFIPPAVEPAQPPTNMSKTRITFAAVSHLSKSAVTNPVVVVMLTTEKAESRSALLQEEPRRRPRRPASPTRRAPPQGVCPGTLGAPYPAPRRSVVGCRGDSKARKRRLRPP